MHNALLCNWASVRCNALVQVLQVDREQRNKQMSNKPLTTELLVFIDVGVSSSGKTHKWYVCSNGTTHSLGEVSWFSSWRRYVFTPGPNTLFDCNCLNEIIQFISARMEERK